MSQFMLLLHETPADFARISPEEMQEVIREYTEWRNNLERRGLVVASNKLADEGGRILELENGRVRTIDGPFAEAKEVIGGYFVIRASDYDEAVEVSSSCPHLEFGGRIEDR